MKYMHLEVPENSKIFEKIKEIKESTGINSNINAVIHALLNYDAGDSSE